MIKAILIDPMLKRVELVSMLPTHTEVQRLIQSDLWDSARITFKDRVLVADIATVNMRPFFFSPYPNPLFGLGLVVSYSEYGDLEDTTLSVPEVYESVEWIDGEVDLPQFIIRKIV